MLWKISTTKCKVFFNSCFCYFISVFTSGTSLISFFYLLDTDLILNENPDLGGLPFADPKHNSLG